MKSSAHALLKDFAPEAIALRRRLHQIPELKYEEKQTAALVASTLKSYGYEVRSGVGKTGVVALLDSGKPGKTLAFRADIDALPIEEATGAPYRSKHAGVMHACGHDGHTAALLLAARVLQHLKTELRGKIKLLFQPAEEGGHGSRAMIEDGVLEEPHVDAIFAYHNWPGLPLNTFATRPGCILAGSGRFEITIPGKRAHLARPEEATNPVTIGAEWIGKIGSLTLPRTVLNILGFNSGDWKLGTSERAEIVGCYFVEGAQELAHLREHIETLIGSSGSVMFHPFQHPTINTPQEVECAISAAEKVPFTSIQRLTHCMMAGEDFAEYLQHVPGCYSLIGAGEEVPPLHTPHYDFPDAILENAAHLIVELALESSPHREP